MKKQFVRFMHTTISGKFFKATAIVLVLASTQYANAQALAVSNPAAHSSVAAPDATVTHIESNGSNSLFEVKVDNSAAEKFRLLIKATDGTVLFENVYTDKKFAKTFSIPKFESDNLIFVIKGLAGNTTQTFEVNSKGHYVEDVVITKVI